MKKIILPLFTMLSFALSYSQTPINGIIDTDSILALANSPYLVESDLVISPDGKIIIEPGVEVRFANNIKLEVRGILTAVGTETDSITFTSSTDTIKGSWSGIDIKNEQGGNAVFEYINLTYSENGINERCCGAGLVTIKHSSFTNNVTAIGGYSGDDTSIDSCYFSDNTYAITQADKIVSYSVFEHNDYGLYSTERIDVHHSIFTNHAEAALFGGRGVISYTTIEDNNVGISAKYEGFTVEYSNISNNNIGIELDDYDENIPPVEYNEICNNTTYNVKNTSDINADLYTNCWCNSDSAIIEGLIYDGDDDVTKGLVSYDIYDQNCDSLISNVNKSAGKTFRWNVTDSPYVIDEDFVLFAADTLIIDPGVEVRFLANAGLEIRGTLIAIGTEADSITFTSDTLAMKGSWNGIEIKNKQGGNAVFEYINLSYSSIGINEECCWGGLVSVSNASFIDNIVAVGGYSGNITPIDNSYFEGNTYAITQADKAINNSIFDLNDYGLYNTERVDVSNAIFTNHLEVALLGGRGTVLNSTIENNNIGVSGNYGGFTVQNSSISNNNVGIILSEYDGEISPIYHNDICNNSTYNVENQSDINAQLFKNCWCNTDSTTVEDKIFDGWDNSSKGLVDYSMYNDDCIDEVYYTDKANNRVFYVLGVDDIASSNRMIYPNPAVTHFFVDNSQNVKVVSILDQTGKVLISTEWNTTVTSGVDITSLSKGLYFVEIRLKNNQRVINKLYKQ